MKNFRSIIVLLVFVNFMALPSIAVVFGFDLPQTNIVVAEEENHNSVTIFEKTIPKTLNVHDFIKFFEADSRNKEFISHNDTFRISPYLNIFSPPPEA